MGTLLRHSKTCLQLSTALLLCSVTKYPAFFDNDDVVRHFDNIVQGTLKKVSQKLNVRSIPMTSRSLKRCCVRTIDHGPPKQDTIKCQKPVRKMSLLSQFCVQSAFYYSYMNFFPYIQFFFRQIVNRQTWGSLRHLYTKFTVQLSFLVYRAFQFAKTWLSLELIKITIGWKFTINTESWIV